MKKLLLINLFAIFGIGLLLSSCNETPSEIGFPFLRDTVSVEAVSSEKHPFIVDQKVQKQHSRFINMGGFLIGKAGEYKSMAFIRFETLKDTFKFITPEKIISSTVTIKALKYAFGDTTAPLAFDIYKVNKIWSPKTTWDSVTSAGADYIDYSKKVGHYSAKVAQSDTGEVITMDLDKALASEWLFFGDDTLKYINKGIAFVPNENSKVIRKFAGPSLNDKSSSTFFSEVKIVFLNSQNKLDSVEMKTAMEYALSDAPSHLDNPENATDIVLQGAVQYKTDLFFDLSSIPDNVAIHSATLEMTLNVGKSKLSNYGADSLRDLQITATYRKVSGVDTLTEAEKKISSAYGNKGADFVTYKFDLFTYIVEQWMLRDGKKGLVTLSKAPVQYEYNTIDKYVFYGLKDPDPTKRPKLKIVYSVRPSYNYKKGAQ